MTRPKLKPGARKTGQKAGGTPPVVRSEAGQGLVSRAALLSLLSDDNATGAAKASAARTLAEIDGLIGRHQSRPDRAAAIPVDELTKADLVAELARLRARCMPVPV